MSDSVLTTIKRASVYPLTLWRRIRAAQVEAKPYPWQASYPPGISWHLELTPRPVYALLDDAVAAYPKGTCLSFHGKKYSYRKTAKLVAKAATGLKNLGVRRGAKVGLFLPNSPYFVICYYAVLKAGGTVVNFNPLYAEREIASQIQDSETSIMITLDSTSLYPKVAKRLADTCLAKIVVCHTNGALRWPQYFLFTWFRRREIISVPADERYVTFDDLVKNPGDCQAAALDPERDVAVLQYTGGTTGTPKGAMLTHANLYFNAVQLKTWATGITFGKEKCLAVLPFFHAYGMTGVMNFGLAIGAELVLLPSFKVGEMIKTIGRRRCTMLLSVPTIYSALSVKGQQWKSKLSTLRICISGGAPLPAEIQSAFEQLAGCAVIDGYGLTEASPVCSLGPIGGRNKAGSVGLPLPRTVIEILSLADPDCILRPGELGEICIRGPQIMAGYWKEPGETAAVLDRGRLRTGDFGYLDEDGYLFIVDRIKEMIISGGFNVYPRMVEQTILLHPAIVLAAVCGLPDHHRGERVKAYVKLHDEARLTAAELRIYLKDRLASFAMPSEIEFVKEIPAELLHRPARKDLLARKFAKQTLMRKIFRKAQKFLPRAWRP